MTINPLYRLRYEQNISVDRLAKETGMSSRTIVKIENGRQKRIYIPTLHKIGNFFNIDGLEFQQNYLLWLQNKNV